MLNKPTIDWFNPVFPAVCLTLMFVTAYGGLRGDDPIALVHALAWLYISAADRYLSAEKEKGLPWKSYLVSPLPPIRP